MELKVTRYEIEDRVATLTLDRPERPNSWTDRTHTEYRWVLDQAERDSDLHRDVGAAVRDADTLLERMMSEADYREAVSALAEKRPPLWSRC